MGSVWHPRPYGGKMVSFEIWTTGNNEPEGEWRVGDMHFDPLIRLRSLVGSTSRAAGFYEPWKTPD